MAAEGGDGEVIGWERFFNEVQSLIRCSEMRIGRADRSFSLHIIERLQMATENIAAIGCLLNSATELREYCQCLGDLIEAIHGIILEWELHLDNWIMRGKGQHIELEDVILAIGGDQNSM